MSGGASTTDTAEASGRRAGRTWARPSPVTVLAAAMALLGFGAWLGATLTTTPREAALTAEPPPPSVIVGQIESRVVTQEIVTRGQVRAERSVEAIGQGMPDGASLALLSRPLPRLGDTFTAGQVVAELSGRPVILLPGTVPMYRPLAPGSVGADVTQLQEALRTIGHDIGDPGGSFGEETLAAVQATYAAADYTVPAGGIPLGEVLFMPGFPATVTAAKGGLGTLAGDAQLTLASGKLTVAATFPAKQHALLAEGDTVVLSSEALGQEATATIGNLRLPTPAGQDASAGTTVEILTDAPLPSSWAGEGVRVRVITAASTGEALAIPIGGIFRNAAGGAEVAVITEASSDPAKLRFSRVPVTVGAVGGGYAEVSSADPLFTVGASILLSSPPAS